MPVVSKLTPLSALTWPRTAITWAFASPATARQGLGTYTRQIVDAEEKAAVTKGVMMWAAVSGVTLTEVADSAAADIQLIYADCRPEQLIGQCVWNYNPTNNTFNYVLVRLMDPSISPLSKNAAGNLQYGNGVELQQLACHEFGAGLGLAEGTGSDSSSIMNHVLDSRNRVPDADDIAAIQKLFGAPKTAPTPSPTPAPVPAPAPKPHKPRRKRW